MFIASVILLKTYKTCQVNRKNRMSLLSLKIVNNENLNSKLSRYKKRKEELMFPLLLENVTQLIFQLSFFDSNCRNIIFNRCDFKCPSEGITAIHGEVTECSNAETIAYFE